MLKKSTIGEVITAVVSLSDIACVNAAAAGHERAVRLGTVDRVGVTYRGQAPSGRALHVHGRDAR